ncbi:hypothetical protein [Polynucleobacter difficilis]|uniref:hypothetical protein n=1 Tax=Polynucleobacter difficilis TaxID=556054 RepID=UPI000D3A90C5|nr:hypothetical protein [Polynucleobacter difficilis]
MHTSAVETQALTHAQAIGFAMLLAGHIDSERRLRQAQRCLRYLGIDNFVDCSLSTGGNERHLHFRASHRLLALCPDFDTANITTFLRTHQPQKDPALMSEIILAMALSPNVVYFDSVQELKSNLRMRCTVVNAASRTELNFDTSSITRPQAYWIYTKENGFLLRQGVSLADGLERALCPDVSGYTYAFSCQRASEYLILYAVVRELQKVNKTGLNDVEQQWRKRALTGDDFLFRFLGERGTRENPMPMHYYIPGDRIWFKNPDDHSSDIEGFEGSWVIYLGGGRFCNLWDCRSPYTLEEKCLEIYYWSQCVEVSPAGVPWMNEAVVKERVQLALDDPVIKKPILQKMMVYRDPTGVYADGGCIDLSRDSFSALSNISERMQSV